MSKSGKGLILIIMIVVVAAIVGCSKGFGASLPSGSSQSSAAPAAGTTVQAPANGRVQSNSGGAVDVEVEWKQAGQDSLIFEVSMNTHSVNLDQYDLAKLSVLRDDLGQEYHPTSWRSQGAGHHRGGTLIFPLPDSLGQGKARYLELFIRDVAGVQERILRWELKQS